MKQQLGRTRCLVRRLDRGRRRGAAVRGASWMTSQTYQSEFNTWTGLGLSPHPRERLRRRTERPLRCHLGENRGPRLGRASKHLGEAPRLPARRGRDFLTTRVEWVHEGSERDGSKGEDRRRRRAFDRRLHGDRDRPRRRRNLRALPHRGSRDSRCDLGHRARQGHRRTPVPRGARKRDLTGVRTLLIAPKVAQQMREARRWWVENRPKAPCASVEELRRGDSSS